MFFLRHFLLYIYVIWRLFIIEIRYNTFDMCQEESTLISDLAECRKKHHLLSFLLIIINYNGYKNENQVVPDIDLSFRYLDSNLIYNRESECLLMVA